MAEASTKPECPDVTVVAVGYESADVLAEMLDSIPAGTPIVVVDNNSQDTTAEIAEDRGAKVFQLSTNSGFGAACNFGARGVSTPFVLFLNPDTRLMPGALDAFLESAERHPDASAFNPKLYDQSGRQTNRTRSAIAPQLGRSKQLKAADDVVVPVLSGSALFCRTEAFRAAGGFDEAMFMYHEDDDLSLRLARDHGPLMLSSKANVLHIGSASSRAKASIVFSKAKYRVLSRIYAERKYARRSILWRLFWRTAASVSSPYNLLSLRYLTKTAGTVAGAFLVFRGEKPSTVSATGSIRESKS